MLWRHLDQLIAPGSFTGAIGPQFQWNVLNYGRLLNNIRLQDATFNGLVAFYQNTVVNASAEVAKNQKDYYNKLFTDQTSVNVDEEMVKLQVLQISYQAAARLIGIVQQMNQTITDMVR